jgi:transposase InsO family protein
MKTIAKALEVSRSNLHDQLKPKNSSSRLQNRSGDDSLLLHIKKIVDERPTYGYRRVTSLLRRDLNIAINHKRIYRLMKQQNLLLQRYDRKPTRTHDGKIITLASDMRWCSDGFRLQCANGEHVEIAFSLDCHDREIIRWVASTRGIDGGLIRDLMAESVEQRFGSVTKLPKPIQWLSDNGPGYTARETVAFGRMLGFEVCTTPSYSPESNGMAEAFVKTFKRDYAHINALVSAESVIQMLSSWFEDYNENAPHKGLKMMAPRQYRRELCG